jgi:methyltransferase
VQVVLELAVVFAPMLVEARRAARNERLQRARGGIEPPDDVYGIMRVAYPGAFMVMIIDGAMRGGSTALLFVAGLVMFGAAKALKWWAIRTLGPCWTFRVIVVPGTARVASGPYRYVRHPNYFAVTGELIAVALMTGASVLGAVVTLAFGLLIWRRIAVESSALDAILRR